MGKADGLKSSMISVRKSHVDARPNPGMGGRSQGKIKMTSGRLFVFPPDLTAVYTSNQCAV